MHVVNQVPNNVSFEMVAQPILDIVRWPDPGTVKLGKFKLPAGNRHASKINQLNIPSIPGEQNLPYFLMHKLQPNAERIQNLKGMANNNPVVIFAESGAGKTRSLMELFSKHFGILLVCHQAGTYTKNYGSRDLTSLCDALKELVPLARF